MRPIDLRASNIQTFLLNQGEIFQLTFTFPENYPSLSTATGTSDIKLVSGGGVVASNSVAIDEDTRTVVVTMDSDVSAGLSLDVTYQADLKLTWTSQEVRYPSSWRFVLSPMVTT